MFLFAELPHQHQRPLLHKDPHRGNRRSGDRHHHGEIRNRRHERRVINRVVCMFPLSIFVFRRFLKSSFKDVQLKKTPQLSHLRLHLVVHSLSSDLFSVEGRPLTDGEIVKEIHFIVDIFLIKGP